MNDLVVNYPLTRSMYCGPCEGAAIVLCRGDLADQYTDSPVFIRAVELRSRRHGAFELQSPSLPLGRRPAPPSTHRVRPTRLPASVPATSTSPNCRTPMPDPS